MRQHVLTHPAHLSHPRSGKELFKSLISFADSQQKYRLGWKAGSMMVETTVLFPATMLIISANGGSFLLMMLAVLATAAVLIMDLAAQHTRLIIPVFFGAVAIQLLIILSSFVVPGTSY